MSSPLSKKPTGFTPAIVHEALGDINHRFILILECENREYVRDPSKTPPRFSIGGENANLDPRDVLIPDLIPLCEAKIQIPVGFELAHELLQVVFDCTDEHGWQYRTCWPQRELRDKDELWSSTINHAANVRWRLWMTTLVHENKVLDAKKKISEMAISHQKGVIMESLLLRLEQDSEGVKSWVKKRVVLLEGKIQVTDIGTGLTLNEYDLSKFEIKMMNGFAFSVRSLDGLSCVLFDADSAETKRQWLAAISYQKAVRSTMISFPPFPYAPPLGTPRDHSILCGELLRKDGVFFSSSKTFFRLTSTQLQYSVGGKKKVLQLESAAVKTKKTNLQITLIAKSGLSVIMKATDEEQRDIWIAALTSQIEAVNEKKKSIACKIPAEARAMLLYNSDDLIAVPSLAIDNTSWRKEKESDAKNAEKKNVEFLLDKVVSNKDGNVPKSSKASHDSDTNTDSESEMDAHIPPVILKVPREETKEDSVLLCV